MYCDILRAMIEIKGVNMKRFHKTLALTALLATTLSAAFAESLFVYSGAGLKKPMEEIAAVFEKNHDATVEFNFAGSGQLLAQLATTGKGDLFIVGSEASYEAAEKKGLVGNAYGIAHHTPAIVVLKGNPKNIQSLEDLSREGVKVILGEPKANAIGKTAQEILKKNHLEKINDNVVSTANTVNEMAVQLTLGTADAMIATIDAVYNNPKVEIIEIPAEQNIDQIVTGGIVTSTQSPELSKAFMDLTDSPEGREIFARHGFAPVTE